MSNPKISIVIPNYNQGHSIGRLLEQCCQQNPHQVLVIDDGSTDNSQEVLTSFEHYDCFSWVHFPKSQDWHRALAQRCKPYLNGDYVIVKGADDQLYPGFVQRMTEVLGTLRANQQYPSVAFAEYDFYDETGTSLRAPARCGVPATSFLSPAQANKLICSPRIFECGVAALLHRGMFHWLHKYGQDMGPWFDSVGLSVVAAGYGAVYVPEVLGGYCHNSDPTIGYAQRVCHNEADADRTFKGVLSFLRRSDVKLEPRTRYVIEVKTLTCIRPRSRRSAMLRWLGTQLIEHLDEGQPNEAVARLEEVYSLKKGEWQP